MSDQIVISVATAPDIDALCAIHKFGDLSDEGVLNAALHLHNQQHGSKVLPLYQQQIVSIAAVKRMKSGEVVLFGFDSEAVDEVDWLIQLNEFAANSEKMVSWNMNHFDLPLINHRFLRHSMASTSFYNASKVDLSDCLSNDQNTADADLAALSLSLGLPDINALTTQETTECLLNNEMQAIHAANHTKALNSYLIYLRYQLVTSELTSAEQAEATEKLFEVLGAAPEAG